jgi:hypothetical protein
MATPDVIVSSSGLTAGMRLPPPPPVAVDNWTGVQRANTPTAPFPDIQDSLSFSLEDSLVLDKDSLKNMESVTLDENQVDSLQISRGSLLMSRGGGVQQDSLSYDEDTFVKNDNGNSEFYDSISSSKVEAVKVKKKKKLIIPYADSYSSTTSVFTSQEDDDDDEDDEVSLGEDDEEEEEEMGDRIKDLRFDIKPASASTVQMRRPVSASPAIPANPGRQSRVLPNPNLFMRHQAMAARKHGSNSDLVMGRYSAPSSPANLNNGSPMQYPGNSNLDPDQAVSPQQQSLLRLTTERMKRKFLGWN